VSNFFPEASVLGFPIIVARPISGRDKETGDPVLILSSLSSTVDACHSGLARSRFCSEITVPQLLHMTTDGGWYQWKIDDP